MIRYFKKYDTRVRVAVGGGFSIPFEDITDEEGHVYEWGVLASQDGYVNGELDKLIARGEGGVVEISCAEYESLKKKEHQKLLPFWREIAAPKFLFRELLNAGRHPVVDVNRANLPEVVRGMKGESRNLPRPVGVLSNWKPATVER